MKIVFICGDQPRHLHLARRLAATGTLAGLVLERREAFVPPPPPGLPEDTSALFIRHFANRESSENQFFGAPERPHGPRILDIALHELNTPVVWNFLRGIQPDLLLSYGCHKLSPATLALAGERWNIHGGLSPWYRGVTTHFWPSYMLEPQMTGMTVHDTTEAIDGGAVVHQVAGPMVRGDGIHDLACRTVHVLGEELASLIEVAGRGGVAKKSHATTGRIWRAEDWRPAHLHLVYETYGDRIVDHALDGRLGQVSPHLHRQF